MNAAELLVKCLGNEGVTTVFGIPGEETMAVTDALIDSGIRLVTCRHEQGAAFMADVWGRLTGRAGVCLTTLGPGATNLATGLADANLDRAPVVAITGQAGRDRIHEESHQYVDVVDMFRPITKWNARLEVAAVVPEAMRKAFKVAEAEKPGVCHVELPEDVAEEAVREASEPLATGRPRRPSPDRQALQRAAELIDRARSPLLFAGNGVIRGKASQALRELAGRTGMPVVNTFMAKGCVPWDHELALGTVGLQARDAVTCGFEAADARRPHRDRARSRGPQRETPAGPRSRARTQRAPLARCSWSVAPSFKTVRTTRSVGSFVNVIALRFPRRQASSRSRRSISASRRT
jgi:acetolactate synthase I/II/III large subunit